MKEEKLNILLNLPTIASGAWTARSVSVPAVMNQMVTRVDRQLICDVNLLKARELICDVNLLNICDVNLLNIYMVT